MSSLLDNHNKSTNIKENMNLDKESNNTTNLTRQSGDEETNDSNKSSSKKYVPKEIEDWDDVEIMKPDILRGIFSYGFEKPSPIQKKGLMSMIDGKDMIAQAQSGTGKTGCFTVGSLQKINTDIQKVQCLILAPTRELSLQIHNVLNGIGCQMKELKTHVLIGGTSVEKDIKILKENTPHIIVGCPGRVQDMLRRGHLRYEDISLVVVDEADEMLSSGFKDQIYNIFQYLPYNVQITLFSATIPHDLYTLTEKFMRDPVKILVKAEMLTLDGIAQYFVALENDDQKFQTLKDIYGTISVSQCIIYCNSVRRVADLYNAMKEEDFPVCCIHSNMEKEDRIDSYNEFKKGKFRVLISSDVTSRGIDIQQVSTVINFDIPKSVHTYLHRIGRSGRWGRKGVGINFTTRLDFRKMKNIEDHYQTQITELPLSFIDENKDN
jgi:translation initiation factor 4A